jgi:hypothetical protein
MQFAVKNEYPEETVTLFLARDNDNCQVDLCMSHPDMDESLLLSITDDGEVVIYEQNIEAPMLKLDKRGYPRVQKYGMDS